MRKIALMLLLMFTAANAEFVGSENSDKYHRQSCEWAHKISPENLVVFENAEEAASSGYVPCKVCKPASYTPAAAQSKEKVSQPAYSGRCTAITKKGTQCKRKAEPGTSRCWQH